jgi:hypothetical protein
LQGAAAPQPTAASSKKPQPAIERPSATITPLPFSAKTHDPQTIHVNRPKTFQAIEEDEGDEDEDEDDEDEDEEDAKGTAGKIAAGGSRRKYVGTGKVYEPPCDRCQKGKGKNKRRCEQEATGGSCLPCKQSKHKCSYAKKGTGKRDEPREETKAGKKGSAAAAGVAGRGSKRRREEEPEDLEDDDDEPEETRSVTGKRAGKAPKKGKGKEVKTPKYVEVSDDEEVKMSEEERPTKRHRLPQPLKRE